MATKMMDIALSGGDVLVAGGDFSIVESTGEHQTRLILDGKGDYKQNPEVGVGAFDYLDDDGKDLPGAIAQAFAQDGMDVLSVGMKNGVINSDAFYR